MKTLESCQISAPPVETVECAEGQLRRFAKTINYFDQQRATVCWHIGPETGLS